MSILHIPFYPSDWLAGTGTLSDAEKGVYITLIAKMYEMAGAIERDDERLSRLCGCKSKTTFRTALKYLVEGGKIQDQNGELSNERVEKEIKKVTEKSSKAKQAAESRWSKKPNKNNKTTHADASPEHMPQLCQLEPEPELEEDTGVSSNPHTPMKSVVPFSNHPDLFSELWTIYPNKTGRKNAAKAWEKARGKIEHELMLSRLRDYVDVLTQPNPPIACHLSTWLNQERWTDDLSYYREQSNASSVGGARFEGGRQAPSSLTSASIEVASAFRNAPR